MILSRPVPFFISKNLEAAERIALPMICIAGRRLGCLGYTALGLLTGTNLQGRCRSSSAKNWRRGRGLHSRWSALGADGLLSWAQRLRSLDPPDPFQAR